MRQSINEWGNQWTKPWKMVQSMNQKVSDSMNESMSGLMKWKQNEHNMNTKFKKRHEHEINMNRCVSEIQYSTRSIWRYLIIYCWLCTRYSSHFRMCVFCIKTRFFMVFEPPCPTVVSTSHIDPQCLSLNKTHRFLSFGPFWMVQTLFFLNMWWLKPIVSSICDT